MKPLSYLLLPMITFFVLSSCGKEFSINNNSGILPNEVQIRAATNIEKTTRAAAYNEVPDFSLFGYIYDGESVGEANYCNNEKMTKSSQYFTSERRHLTVPSGENFLLLGVGPYGSGGWTINTPSGSNSPEITYATPVSVADQKDIVVSEYNTVQGFSGFCEMTFSHILSGIRFSYNPTQPRPKITSVSLKNIYSKGIFTLGDSWKQQNTPVTRNMLTDETPSGAFDAQEQTFMVLPQTMPQDAELIVMTDNTTLSAPLSGTVLEKGKMYTYTLNISETHGLSVSVSEPLDNWTYSETVDLEMKPSVIPYRDSIIEITTSGSISIPEWARYADIFMVNGGNNGTEGTSTTKSGKGGLGGKTKTSEDIPLAGGAFDITIGAGGYGGKTNTKGEQTKIQYYSNIFSPDEQGANTGTGVGADGTAAPSWTGRATTDLFGASGGAGNSSSIQKGGNTEGGSGGKAGSSSSSVTKATAGTFYGAGGGGGYYYSSSRIGNSAAGYQGIVIIRFRNKEKEE